MSVDVLFSEKRHAQIFNYLSIVISHNFSLLRINGILLSVQMHKCETKTQQRLNQGDVFFYV